ncbi:diguanylate cyclase [Kaistia nematophila]|uniref:Diguanylate cyclase n=1 Tax=Kaistia nematophila TaxID=2994654 RepID=A0A9X3E4U5_9HYPH|nr:diguanylate cyclase [Kaistia nematophila]
MQRFLLPMMFFAAGVLLYVTAGGLGVWLMRIANSAPAFWPANGLAVALILSVGIHRMGWVLAGIAAAGFVLQKLAGAGALGTWIALGDILEIAIVTIAAHRARLLGSGLQSIASVVTMIAILMVATVANAVMAAVGVALFRQVPVLDSVFMLWRLDMTSALLVLAPFFAIATPGRLDEIRQTLRHGAWARGLEYLALVAVILGAVVFMWWSGQSLISFFTAPLLWCAIRFGQAPTTITASCLSLLIILLTIAGEWPNAYSSQPLAWQLQRIELSLSLNTLPTLFIAAAMAGLHKSARALKQSQERLRYALAGSGEGVWDWNIATGETYFSDSWHEILGYEPGEIEPHERSWDHLRHPDDNAENRRRIADHLEGRTPRYSIEQRFRHKNGDWIWVLDRGSIVERDAEGRPLRAVGTLQDISRLRARQDELDRRAHHDSLTGLANRTSLIESFERWNREKRSFCFVLIDLDAFKPINDRFGHQFGDHVLLAIADCIRACIGKDDVAARLGGDEFALLIDAPQADTEFTARRLIERISEAIGYADSLVTTGASIGIAPASDGAPDFETTYRMADIALYDAKAAGGSIYRTAGSSRPSGQSRRGKPASALPGLAGEDPADDATGQGEDAADHRDGRKAGNRRLLP